MGRKADYAGYPGCFGGKRYIENEMRILIKSGNIVKLHISGRYK